ncbi:hypothetical protein VIGAN_01473300, partial [Vigna angularis var. angularis]
QVAYQALTFKGIPSHPKYIFVLGKKRRFVFRLRQAHLLSYVLGKHCGVEVVIRMSRSSSSCKCLGSAMQHSSGSVRRLGAKPTCFYG